MSISTIAAFTKNAATCLTDVPPGNTAGHTNSTKNETASAGFTKRWRWLQLLLLIMATTLAGMVGQAQTVTIGTGTSTSNGTSADPVQQYYNYTHTQIVYLASDLTAGGMAAGANITGLGFSISEVPAGGAGLANFEISLGHTAQTIANPMVSSGLQVVRPAATYLPVLQAAGNFDMITFGTPFIWNGTSNIVVNICTGSNPYLSPYGGLRYSTGTSGVMRYVQTDGTNNCTNYAGTNSANRPNIRFAYTAGANCTGTPATGGTASLLPSTGLGGQVFSASATGTTNGAGINYQWEKSADGIAGWSAIAGATNTTSNITAENILGNYFYRLKTTCSNSGLSNYSNVVNFTTNDGVIATYGSDILALYNASPTTSTYSTCPGTLSVVVPPGKFISNITAQYNFTAQGGGYMSEQRSFIYSPTLGLGESSVTSGTGSSGGTLSYSRALPFALGAMGTVQFQLHALRTYSSSSPACNNTYNFVPSGSWKLMVEFATCPSVTPPTTFVPSSPLCGLGIPQVEASGATGGQQYRWYLTSTGGTALNGNMVGYENTVESASQLQHYEINTTTTFYVSIKDGFCESGRTPVVATVLAADPITITGPISICYGNSLALSAASAAAYTYSWVANPELGSGMTGNPVGASQNITPVTEGTYTYTVTGVAGNCAATKDITVTVNALPPVPTVSASPNSVCDGSNVELSAVVSAASAYCTPTTSATPGNELSDDNITNFTFAGINNNTGDGPGDYNYYNLSANVTAGSSYLVSISPEGSWSETMRVWIDFNQNGIFEPGESVFNSASSSAIATGTIAIPSNAYNGITRLRVLCKYSSESLDTDACSVGSSYAEYEDYDVNITGGVNNPSASFTYTWKIGNTVIGSGSPFTTAVAGATTYTAVVTNSAGCESSADVLVNVNAVPAAPSYFGFSFQCGAQIPVGTVVTSTSGEPAPVFRWYDDQFAGNLLQDGTADHFSSIISTTTTFWVCEVNAVGCESPRIQVDAYVIEPDAITLNTTSTSICFGSSIDLSYSQTGSTNNYVYSLTANPEAGSGITNPVTPSNPLTVTPTAAGTYTYTLDGVENDCVAQSSVSVLVIDISATPVITVTPTIVCPGSEASLTVPSGIVNTYCAVNPTTSTCCEKIGNVTFGSINNYSSSTGGYEDFTALSTNVSAGSSYPINLTSGTFASYSSDQVLVWIDFNQDGDFDDAGEAVLVTPESTSPWSGTISIPSGAYNGPTRMRIRMHDNSLGANTTPCGNSSYGQVEDYSVNITGGASNPSSGTYLWSTGATGNSINVNPLIETTYSVVFTGPGGCASVPAYATVSVHPVPAAPIATNSAHCGDQVPTASVSGAGGTYKWYDAPSGGSLLQDGGSTYTHSINTTTTFYVSETNSFGCEGPRAAVTVTVTVPNPITAFASNPAICIGSPLALVAMQMGVGQTYTYDWTATPATGSGITGTVTGFLQSITPSAPGVYSYNVTGTDATGPNVCIVHANVSVTVNALPPTPVFTATPPSICQGNSSVLAVVAPSSNPIGTATTTASIGYTPMYRLWEGQRVQYLVRASELNAAGITGAASLATLAFNVTSIPSGSDLAGYTIRLAHTSAATITTFQNPAFTTVYNAATFNAVVGNNIFNFSAPFAWNGTDNLLVDISWDNDANGTCDDGSPICWSSGPSVNYSNSTFASTVYYYADNSGTPRTISTINTVSGTSTNKPNMVFGLYNPGIYTWSTGATGPTLTVSPSVTTNYTVKFKNTATGCTSLTSAPVAVNVVPLVGNDITVSPVNCANGNFTLTSNATGAPGLIYTWNDGVGGTYPNAATITANLPAGTYNFTVDIMDLCSVVRTVSKTVVVNTLPTIDVATSVPAVCGTGASATLTASGASTYAWSPAAGLSATTGAVVTATPAITSTYTVNGTDANGCVGSTTHTVVVGPAVTVTATATPATVCPGGSSQLLATASTGGGGSTPLATACTPPVANAAISTARYISNVVSSGGVSNFTNPTGLSTNRYGDFTATKIVTANPGTSVTITGTGGASDTYGWGVCVDLNGNGIFESSEITTSGSYLNVYNRTFTAPTDPGSYRIRVMNNWLTTNPSNSCAASGGGTATNGEVEDYVLQVLAPAYVFNFAWTAAPNSTLDNTGITNPMATNINPNAANVPTPADFTIVATEVVSGCSGSAIVTVTAVDDEAPLAPASLPVITGECAATVDAPIAPDNCVGNVTGTTIDPITSDVVTTVTVFEQGVNIITWTFDDGHGNISTVDQTVNLDDVTPPPAPASLPTYTAECEYSVTVVPTVEDECAKTIEGIPTDPGTGDVLTSLTFSTQGVHTIRWVFDDGNGNTSYTDQDVVIQDVTAPALVDCPADIMLPAHMGVATWTAPTATDNCGYGLTVTQTAGPASGSTFANGTTTTITYTATDAGGNSVDCSFNVTRRPELVISVTYNPIMCNGNMTQVTISGSGGNPPYWGTGTFTVGSGTYNFAIWDADGAMATTLMTIAQPDPLLAACGTNNPELFFGYAGDNTATIIASATGGTGPYTISFSMNRPLKCNISWGSSDETWVAGANTATNTYTVCPGSGSLAQPPVSTSTATLNAGETYSLNVSLMQDAVITATITDANGCVQKCTTPIFAQDVRCLGGIGNLVKICHKQGTHGCRTMCVSQGAVAAHLAHGDYLGECTTNCHNHNPWPWWGPGWGWWGPGWGWWGWWPGWGWWGPGYGNPNPGNPWGWKGDGNTTTPPIAVETSKGGTTMQQEATDMDIFSLKVAPNPSSTEFVLNVSTANTTDRMLVNIYDVTGKIYKQFKAQPSQLIRFGQELRPGTYLVEVLQSGRRKTATVIKL